ncbi:unnamed protein product [Bursaphelenchus xylophilus]|uniref:(pine wood nematode) hypothetical protein n=1 Tax=Bursaphelenchus xylophilus TaxID=6326 RepID=A0A1I7RQM3_BURXY|nr:unnamed protein product [Bursaphelenchus xylophilus]CAG9104824.1 unnamed protein product [Bursaphelenchus xylophilus]
MLKPPPSEARSAQPTPKKIKKHVKIRTSSEGPVERKAFSDRKLDRNDPDYLKELRRPAVIKCDLSEMDRRRRVRQVLEHKDFCTQLESLISKDREAFEEGDSGKLARSKTLPTIMALTGLQKLSFSNGRVKIADMAGNDKYTIKERILRNKLAALYRLVDLFQWSQGIYNHITLRLPESEDKKEPEFLINPFGLLYHEITASSLIKIDIDGNILDNGSTSLGVNKAGYVLHSAIHKARPDMKCILHLHTAVVAAVSSMKCGLLPICQEAMIIGSVAYHDYQGIVSEESMREKIVEDLGDKNVLLLRNHGFVACGESVEDALHLAFHTIIACETQIRAARVGIDNLVIPSHEAVSAAYTTARSGGGGVNKTADGEGSSQYRIGELEWEAWMRVLDGAGYQTGHIYRNPSLKSRLPTLSSGISNLSEISLPPSLSSHGLADETDSHYFLTQAQQEKVRWLNSPNNYQKVEFKEEGRENPKTITKWVSERSSSVGGTPVKISSAHQFSPITLNGDANEMRRHRDEIRENQVRGDTSPGPISQIFDGILIKDQNPQFQHFQTISTASKGIIDREFQHNARVFQHLYAPNPFSNLTNQDLEAYLDEIKLKSRSASAMEPRQVEIVREDSPQPSPIERSKSFDFDTASLMQACRHLNSRRLPQITLASHLDAVNNNEHVYAIAAAQKEEKPEKKKRSIRNLFSLGRKKKNFYSVCGNLHQEKTSTPKSDGKLIILALLDIPLG